MWLGAGTALVALGQRGFALHRYQGLRKEVVSYDEIIFPFLLLGFGPAAAVITMTLGYLLANVLVRRETVKIVFNTGQAATASGVAAWLVWLTGGIDIATATGIAVVTMASFAFAATLFGIFTVLLSLLESTSWLQQAKYLLREDGSKILVETLVGVTFSMAVFQRPLLLVLAVPTGLLMLTQFRRWFNVRRERTFLGEVLDASTAIHQSNTLEEAEAALADAVFTLAGTEARVAEFPDREHDPEWAFPLDLSDDNRWLVLTRRAPGLESDERAIVETLVEVARVAIDNIKLLEERRRTSDQLRRLLDDKDRFLAAVAHAIRTPLTAIGGFAFLAAESQMDEPQRDEAMGLITTQVDELSMLVDNLLIAARSDTDQVGLAHRLVDVGTEVEKLVGVLGLEDRLKLHTATDCLAFTDHVRLRQLLRNLIVNAVTHGGPAIEVTVSASADSVNIEICDNGQGISQLDSHSFDDLTGSGFRGSAQEMGLGLSVAHFLSTLMGGRLTYRRDRGWTILRLELMRATHLAELIPAATP